MANVEEKNGTGNKEATNNLLMTSQRTTEYDLDSLEDEEEDAGGRRGWDKKMEYILSAVGYCVGLGNIWRFPYVCMRNGGGAFLIPFFLSLFLCALPLYFMESALGQFNGRSSYLVWNICPLFKGIGVSMNVLSFFFVWYSGIILGWTLVYLGYSFTAPLPWAQCDEEWNSPNCITPLGNLKNSSAVGAAEVGGASGSAEGSDLLMKIGSGLGLGLDNSTNTTTAAATAGAAMMQNATSVLTVSSTEEFWVNKVLERSSGLDDWGGLTLHNSIALIVANVCITMAVIKGIRSTGKVVYVTATLPYMLLTVILILGFTLPGSGDGMLYYIKPDFSKLFKTDTWIDAFIQVFYSLGPGWGPLITMSSYNKFNNNCMRDSIILTICCEGTSIFAGFAIFSVLGHMAYLQGVAVDTFAKSGVGLTFIVYPTALSYLPVPQLWSVLFFTMLFTLGLDSMFASVETLMTTLVDFRYRIVNDWRKTTTVVAMALTTLASLVFASRGGIYIFSLMDWYIAAFPMIIQVFLEIVVVAWIYGTDRFSHDIELMIGRKPYPAFIVGWKFVAPSMLLTVLIVTLFLFEPARYGDHIFSPAAQAIGWILSSVPFFFIVIFFVIALLKQKGNLLTRMKSACRPHREWGPAPSDVREKYAFNDDSDIRV